MDEFIDHPATFPVATTALFVTAFVAGTMAPSAGIAWLEFAAKALLAAAFLALGGWFLHAFTRADSMLVDDAALAQQRASMFRFAYMFSLFSFAVLVLPFTAMLRDDAPPDTGPIRLLRACVHPAAPPPAGSAPRTPGPVDLCPNPPLVGGVSYPWVVAVGGVVAQQCGQDGLACSRAMPADPSTAGTAPVATHKSQSQRYEVTGGFVVPFYVVVLAFVGGVVNLTRRVPEYQKRSSVGFAGTPAEPIVTMLEAREFVVFQILQLISAPFVAMVAYHALEPKSVASAAGLAFICGLATEAVLLLVRGLVSGIKPETSTKTAAAASGTASTARLRVVVRRGGLVLGQAKVEVRRLPGDPVALEKGTTDAQGVVDFPALAAGPVWVVVTPPPPGDGGAAPPPAPGVGGPALPPPAPVKVTLVAGQVETVEITV